MLRPVVVMLTYEGPEAFTMAAVANLFSRWNEVDDQVPRIVLEQGGDPAAQMYEAVRTLRFQAATKYTDGILSIEHDHFFEPEDAWKLLRVAKSQPGAIVGGLYYQRQADILVGDITGPLKGWEDVPTPAYHCRSVGLGFTFIPWSVFDKVKEPWFRPEWTPPASAEGKWTRSSHDQAFCAEAAAADVPIIGVLLENLAHKHVVPPRRVRFKA